MFKRLGAERNTLDDISRVEDLVRALFKFDRTNLVLVSQDAGHKPGFPPIETNVIFWKNDKRYRLKVFSPVADVTDKDLPVAWLLPALEDTGEGECC